MSKVPGAFLGPQIRTADKQRLVKRVGTIDNATQGHVLALLAELFAP